MRWLGIFNIAYGGLGLASAIYLGRPEGIILCVWVMCVGVAMRLGAVGAVGRFARRLVRRRRTPSV